MKKATVRDLRYHFSEIEARLSRGEEIEVRKRRKVIRPSDTGSSEG